MRIAFVGGLHRNENQIVEIAEKAGHELDFHPGVVGGRGADELRAAIERAELVIIVTDVNSHGAVQLAKKLCNKLGRGSLVLRRCGAARFRQLLDAIAAREVNQLAFAS
ncbi:MAG: DUF2325 domain-containing protein [Polyangiaceae bacterium]|nr:DUF2325 domain-containing protein [Polyangiaceae bacterium]NUQ74425.1 DUF2325 domain-containing protein [Polyangiaceae bacterium]